MAEAIERIGLPRASHSFRTFRRLCDQFGVKVPVYNYSKLASFSKQNRIPDEDVFVVHSTYGRGHLKDRLLKEGQGKECALCHIGTEWNGQALVLQLDHVNGIGDDNRRENLRFVCPNCHSQTGNFAGKNSSRAGEKTASMASCTGCGKKLSTKTGTVCAECRPREVAQWPSDEEVLRQVLATSYEAVGRTLGVSGAAVKKRLKGKGLVSSRPYKKNVGDSSSD